MICSKIGDQTLRIWDSKKSYMAQMVIPAHNSEIITCDWSKYDQVREERTIEFSTEHSLYVADRREGCIKFL